MSIDDTTELTSSSDSLAVHRAGPDGDPTEQIAVARAVTPTAAAIDPVPSIDAENVDALLEIDDTPPPPELPLVLIDAEGAVISVFAVHTSDRSPAIALEVEEPVLTVPVDEDLEHRRDPGRSVWCTIFPRMRGC